MLEEYIEKLRPIVSELFSLWFTTAGAVKWPVSKLIMLITHISFTGYNFTASTMLSANSRANSQSVTSVLPCVSQPLSKICSRSEIC